MSRLYLNHIPARAIRGSNLFIIPYRGTNLGQDIPLIRIQKEFTLVYSENYSRRKNSIVFFLSVSPCASALNADRPVPIDVFSLLVFAYRPGPVFLK